MQVTVTGRHMTITETLKAFCQEKAEHLERFFNRIRLIEVVLDGQTGNHRAEMIVHTDRAQPFVASEQHEDLHAAIDMLVDKIEGQLRRHKERIRNRKHPRPGAEEQVL